jgi:predicted O-methyltransferase YrrM
VNPWELPAVRRILGERGIARARHWLGEARWAVGLVGLPLAVVRFQLRARRLAWRSEDYLSLMSATRPAKLRTLLALARGSQYVAELGTATGWTAISLALADGGRRVITFDVIGRPEPRRYLALAGPAVSERIRLVTAPGSDGPPDSTPVEMLYIDSSHERDQTVAEVTAWRAVLRPGAAVVFDDYGHPDYPGVAEAIEQLGLTGERRGTLFVHWAW